MALAVDVTGALLPGLRRGGKKALADALAKIEAAPTAPETIDLLDQAYSDPRGQVIGITGPPGVGKSTLIAALIAAYRASDETVGVIAVDPSSRLSGGALLGDRVRIDTDPEDQGIFVRSMAARNKLGGLAVMTAAAAVLMRAVFDRVIVETVGVGQSETDVASVADSVILCVQPGSGDSIQYMKAGIAEIPDIALVTKADLGPIATQTKRDLRAALITTGKATGSSKDVAWQVPVLSIAAGREEDVRALIEALDRHFRYLKAGPLVKRRRNQSELWLEASLQEAFGREGVRLIMSLSATQDLEKDQSPFRRMESLHQILSARLFDP